MVLNHKIRRYEIKVSKIAAVTIFWVMLIFSIIISVVLIKYCAHIHQRREMAFINYNLAPLAKMVQEAPEELRGFANFNIHCMLLHVQEVKQTLELYSLAVMFFNLNSLIMLFVAYNKKRKFLMIMGFMLIVFTYFVFTFSQRAAEQLPKKVLGGMYLENNILDK